MVVARKRWIVAAVQLTSTPDVERNVERAIKQVRAAVRRGAALVALPENFAYLGDEGVPVACRQSVDGPLVEIFRAEAKRNGVHILLGSIPEKIPGSRKIHNSSVLLGPDGGLLAVYRKMHLFDIDIRGSVVLKESKTVTPGDRPVVVPTRLGRFGLTICYDLRFPELFRHLMVEGAEVLFVPAAFTSHTGPDHWLPLLRARAIENQCWVVAPAQVGRHTARRRSHGETAIIDPWGKVVRRRIKGEGLVTAEIDLAAVRRVRRGMPCARHMVPRLIGKRL